MPLTVSGTGGGQDGARRAAMQYMGPGPGVGPGATASPAAPAPQSSVGDLLAQAVQATAAAPDKRVAIAAWQQALGMLKSLLENAQQQSAPAPGPQPTGSMMGQMGAQAVAPTVGRFPR